MCGISGIWSLNDTIINEQELQLLNNSIAHRGPDGFGIWLDSTCTVGLGHRRLSILDLTENGKQPMSYSDSRFQITFNGEIFNFIELRKELVAFGLQFKSHSDTEVVLAAYLHWGVECLNRFNGMWAFAIWDNQEQTLFLARDRFGIKPLHYIFQPNRRLAFASEPIAFKNLNGFKRVFNAENVARTLKDTFSLEGTGHTLFNQIYQLLPGHYSLVRKGLSEFKQQRWWDAEYAPINPAISYKEQVDQFRSIFEDSCKIRLRSDVTIATALSGGLDSSSVYCMVNHILKTMPAIERVPMDCQMAFSMHFKNSEFDEKEYADAAISFSGGKIKYIEPDSHLLSSEIISDTIKFDNIYVTTINALSSIYRQMKNDGVTVSLDGHGVDEMLWGYNFMFNPLFKSNSLHPIGVNFQELENAYLNLYKPELRPERLDFLRSLENQTIYEEGPSISRKIKDHLVPKQIKKFYRKHKNAKEFTDFEIPAYNYKLPELSNQPFEFDHHPLPYQIPFKNFHIDTLPTILRNFDRASMMNGIEIRMPFMDYRLVSYVFSLPMSSKIGSGFTKRILRDAMEGVIPPSIQQRTTKIGLNAPINDWFNGPLKEFILDEVNSHSFAQNEIWNGKKVRVFAEKKLQNNNINSIDAAKLWRIINAHILLENQ